MSNTTRHDAWQAGDSYDRYMGRWSRRIAPRFLDWLAPPSGVDWLDVGCGTGALTAAILGACEPASIVALDPSAGFIDKARAAVSDPRVEFLIGDAQALPVADRCKDVIVSGLVLNFVPDRAKALHEMQRVARAGAIVGFYLWDYPGGGIEFMRAFWMAATSLDPGAADLTEDRRFSFCTRESLSEMAVVAGLQSVDSAVIEVPTVFKDFADYWQPFTLGAGPAPGYCAGLPPAARELLRAKLADTLPRQPDGSIHLQARAFATRGRVP